MGITDFFSDVWDTFSVPSPDADAGGKSGQASTNTPSSGTDEESDAEKDVNKKDAKDGGDDEQGHKPSGGEDDEEEEEEETVDPKEQLEEECKNSAGCAGPKHHFDECTERVTGQIENDGKASEDCVEEFFHLAHCATNCAAPKLFAQLK